ncbi:dicarboxylate/amino acid:cation symporter [Pseudidiomarina terrestris]|uniref:Dicarboxylate/amino acid:cation symporter n=1 Tax=Pseudidiomarina terrestris TaxID=2820060 RepID=A0AAW7R328_9GAMM|nr:MULTISPECIES: dicarboxylate/amino acid:cation symporter [unclassified Pseudidiomarina]MDN7125372.1 dicarboxylate/amino acid:cation symporter [Pseudidiomarina sp. 1APP75-32.1]MDN7127976.1 dicarboxylate/amino acid:cation symporter [Pseudidiomarina sp. 1APR75-33.1]MDN7130130.1 dicarboxylate/amino acid:cation symporter [Pseudidiomarina sp. 1APR75-15]MDN7135635.1 dicarboxylate/amino acid:cation symporter [Pseudidiomarina sp. 1ASP75-5]MDN7137327.1 dicarboxylate/amino acid:cation symporter [Pseudi
MGLILKLVLGIVFGTLIGLYMPDWFTQLLLTFKVLFGELLFFTIPLLILFFITSGIAGLPQKSGRLLGRTLVIAYLSTILAGIAAYFIARLVVPLLTAAGTDGTTATEVLEPFITVDVPPVFGIMTALVLAFIFGLGIAATQALQLKQLSDQGRDIIERLLANVIIPLLPFYIAGVFAGMAHAGTVFQTLQTFGIVLLMAVALHWVYLTTMYVLAGLRHGRSPFGLLKTMLPAYFTALGTMSSAATIPVSLRCAKANKVTDDVADFVIPLCATTHLAGSTITIVSCALAVMFLHDSLALPSFFTILPFIMMLGVVMLAAPGVPGGAVMSAVGLLGSMLGFGETAVALMIALYMAQDSFGTACNVTGDGAIALLVDERNNN